MSNSASSSDDDASLHVRCPDPDPSDFSDEQSDSGDVSEDIKDTSNESFDLPWPAADTFTDDTLGRLPLTTCSELGSQRIRLVRIRPGPTSSMIRLDAKVCFLDHAGQYTPLSYTWGSSVLQRQVIFNDEPRAVTTNLWRFLYQARQLPVRFSGWLWIDALSIDQIDPWEKADQVKIISKIFAVANQAVIWVGLAYGDSDRAMKALANIPLSSSVWNPSRALWSPPLGPAILSLSERAYWQRLWVFQELKASSTISLMCGDRLVQLQRFQTYLLADRVDRRIQEKIATVRQSPAAKMLALTNESLDTSFESILRATDHLQCADVRDRAYAILNAVGSSGCTDIGTDYTIPIPELLNRILRSMHEGEELRDTGRVREQCKLLERLFAVDKNIIFGIGPAFPGYSPDFALSFLATAWTPESFSVRSLERSIIGTYAWCKTHGHNAIGRLIYQRRHVVYSRMRNPVKRMEHAVEIFADFCPEIHRIGRLIHS
jgi:hypothetical protein